MGIKKLFFWGILILFVVSCQKPDKPVDKFFKEIDKVLSDEEKSRIDSCKAMECWIGFVLTNTNNDFKNLFDTLPTDLIAVMDSHKIDRKYQSSCLFFAYCKNRVGMKYDFQGIIEEIDQYNYDQQKKSEQSAKRRKIELTDLAEKSYGKIRIHDVIVLEYPTKYENGKWMSFYAIPRSTDTLVIMTGTVVGKSKPGYSEDMSDRPEYLLYIKILDINRQPFEFHFQELSKGDTVEVDIYPYARDITIVPR